MMTLFEKMAEIIPKLARPTATVLERMTEERGMTLFELTAGLTAEGSTARLFGSGVYRDFLKARRTSLMDKVLVQGASSYK